MLKEYRIMEGKLCESSGPACEVMLYVNPEPAERELLVAHAQDRRTHAELGPGSG